MYGKIQHQKRNAKVHCQSEVTQTLPNCMNICDINDQCKAYPVQTAAETWLDTANHSDLFRVPGSKFQAWLPVSVKPFYCDPREKRSLADRDDLSEITRYTQEQTSGIQGSPLQAWFKFC